MSDNFLQSPEWHRLFLIRSETDRTAIRYSEESEGILYYVESDEWSLRLNINARAFTAKRNLTFSRITRDEAFSVYVFHLMIPQEENLSYFFSCHSTSTIIFIKTSFMRFIYLFSFFFGHWIFQSQWSKAKESWKFLFTFPHTWNNVHNHFCGYALCRVIFLILLMISTIISKQ